MILANFPYHIGSLLTLSDPKQTMMAQSQGRLMKRAFKTTEGRFQLYCERANGCSFNPNKPSRLTMAHVLDGPLAGRYIVFNIQDNLQICTFSAVDKVS